MEKKDKKEQIDIRDVYGETTKQVKTYTVNWVKRYGYWAMIFVLFTLSILLSLVTVGDVYAKTELTKEEIYQAYVDSGHVLNSGDNTVVLDLISEALSKDAIISYTEYDKFIEKINSYNYEMTDGTKVRFDSLAFYLFKKQPQKFIDFRQIPEWQITLVVMSSVLGVFTTVVFMQTGIQDALSSKILLQAKHELNEASRSAGKNRLRAEEYFSKLQQGELASMRQEILSSYGMVYSDYFNTEGRLIEKKYSDIEHKIVKRALQVKITKLSFDKLATKVIETKDGSKMVDIKDYKTKTALKSIVFKTMAIVFYTFVSVSLIVSAQETWQIFINIISTLLIFAAGVLEYLNSYSFIVDDYSETLYGRIRYLEGFIEWCDKDDARKIEEARLAEIKRVEYAKIEETKRIEEAKRIEALKTVQTTKTDEAQMIKELEDKQEEVTNI